MSAVFPPQGSFTFRDSFPALPDAAGARRGAGLAVVFGVHVVVAWALATGLAREAVEIIKKPIQMAIIQEVAPPPPPPPPKVEKIKEIPKVAPPPAYVPPPDITPEVPPPAPVIQAVAPQPPPEPVVIAPPPPPAPPAVVKQEISVACPNYQKVLSQMLEDAFDRVGVVGTVQAMIKVRGSQVVDVVPLSGPKDYYKFVQAAIKRMSCSAGGAEEVQVPISVRFAK